MLLIAFAPSLVVMVFGIALAGFLVHDGTQSLDFANMRRNGLPVVAKYVSTLQEERRLTMTVLAGSTTDRPKLTEVRRAVDTSLAQIIAHGQELADSHSPELRQIVADGERGQAELPGVRAGLDSGRLDALAGFDFYNQMIDIVGIGVKRVSVAADDAEVAFEHVVSSDMVFVIESVARGHALALYALGNDDPGVRDRLAAQVNQYRQPSMAVFANLTDAGRTRAARLQESRDWATLLAGDQSVLAGEPFDRAAWQRSAGAVLKELGAIYLAHSQFTADMAEERGRTALWMSVIAGAVVALVTGLAVAAAYRSASRLITRLKDLRRRTLDMSERELPALVADIGSGKDVDPDIVRLDFGRDEIGEVAQAFEKAQQVAIATAVAEAETKRGVRAVFLNIAHRSQVIVHRQLEELDQLERSEDDPDTVDRLFRVDHLATRIRRNAENLIILGGEQVGRGWRKPVSLRDVIRGAISETKHYKRASMQSVPGVRLNGAVVADVGHLIAELVDNGTSFSPPESRVEVRAVVVGKGVVIEIEDQGLGMAEDQLDRINDMLRQPPDFSFMALAGELRIGLFVVARLAAKHDIKITLRESAYGGVRAIVLLPTSMLAVEPSGQPGEPAAEPAPEAAIERPAAPPPAHPQAQQPLPPLPTRVRQDSLAPQLRDEPDTPAPPAHPPHTGHLDRSGAALAAFQRGTARARSETDAANAGQR